MSIALGELAARSGCELQGDPNLLIESVAALGSARPGSLSFLANPKLSAQLQHTGASAVVLDRRSAAQCPTAALISPNPHAAFARIAGWLYPAPPVQPGVHPSALVDAAAQVEESAEIGPYCVIGAGAHIGARCRIGPSCLIGAQAGIGPDSTLVARVTLAERVQLGARALIHPGAVIGADGFGYAREGAVWVKVPQLGTVIVGDDVEIGANTTIDRGAIEDTLIAEGVKLDNQIQIGHNVQIGAHTAIAACTGISGSTRIGARCMIGGQCGFAGHITICDDVVITGMAMVSGSISTPGVYSSGIPLEPARRWRRVVAQLKRLADREGQAGAHSEPEGDMEQDPNDD
ncbi:MAG: UDP-3-O-(3-hydroxymyristoyl)glucosamine N-acyltransferase [Steroidobacteraceae bacterium]|jgi:UDP-3-O-[3-hydroxymyristoyl] glucosamine N-acyltransferase